MIQVDVTQITAREIAPYLAESTKAHLGWLIDLAPKLVKECPWGDPKDAATYEDFSLFSDEFGQYWEAYQKAIKAAPECLTMASFDLSRIKAREFDTLVDHVNSTNVNEITRLLVQYVKTCPEVRDVRDPEAYLDLKYYTQFRPLANRLSSAGKDQLENFLKRFAAS